MTILVYCLFPGKFGLLGGPDCGQDTTKHTRISFYASGPSLNIEATDFVFISMNYNADRAGVLEAVVGDPSQPAIRVSRPQQHIEWGYSTMVCVYCVRGLSGNGPVARSDYCTYD